MPKQKVEKSTDLISSRTSKTVQAKKQKEEQPKQAGLVEVEKSPQFLRNQNLDMRKNKRQTLTLDKPKAKQNSSLITIKPLDNSLKNPQGNKSGSSMKSGSLTSSTGEVIDWKLRFDAEVDKRRNLQKQLCIEKDWSHQFSLLLKKEREENSNLNQQLGALKLELSKKQTIQTHEHGGQISTSYQGEQWHSYVPHQPTQLTQSNQQWLQLHNPNNQSYGYSFNDNYCNHY